MGAYLNVCMSWYMADIACASYFMYDATYGAFYSTY